MKESRSEFINVRGLRYHLRCWGPAEAPPLFILHGWMDVSNSFQFVVDAFEKDWQVIAPDLRGFGLSASTGGSYWFPDYYADLDAIVDQTMGEQPIHLVGHSMGSQVASMYAGVRPDRIRKLVILDGLNVPDMPADSAPRVLKKWLDDIKAPPQPRYYDSYEELAVRVQRNHDRLSPERALHVAKGWGIKDETGRIVLAGDPMHRIQGPSLYRLTEAEAVWKKITAPVLCIDGAKSGMYKMLGADEVRRRREIFSDGRTVVLDDCGHMVHFDQPEKVAAEIEKFLIA